MITEQVPELMFEDALKDKIKSKKKLQKTLTDLYKLLYQIGHFPAEKILDLLQSYTWGEKFTDEFKDDIQNNRFVEAFKRKKTKEILQDEYKHFIQNVLKTKIKPKNILDELIYHEIHKLDELLFVLEELGIIVPDKNGNLSKNDAFLWIENEPTEFEKKKVLQALGYDITKF